jgi:hypothetical protein
MHEEPEGVLLFFAAEGGANAPLRALREPFAYLRVRFTAATLFLNLL